MIIRGVRICDHDKIIASSRRIESIVRGDDGNVSREYKRGYPMEYDAIYYTAATILLDSKAVKGFTTRKAMKLVGFSKEDCQNSSLGRRVRRVRDRVEKRRVEAKFAREKRLLKIYEKRMSRVITEAAGNNNDVDPAAQEKVHVYYERIHQLAKAGNAEAENILSDWKERLADTKRRKSPRLRSRPIKKRAIIRSTKNK